MPEKQIVEPDGSMPPFDCLDDITLLLDFDGTLVELADRPDAVTVDDDLGRLLDRLAARLGGRLAIVSGRSIHQLDAMLGARSRTLALAGSHGAEQRLPGGTATDVARPAALDRVADGFLAFAARRDGLMTELKSLGVALHYRLAPHHGAAAAELAGTAAAEHGLTVQHGKMMVEVRASGDKGRALTGLMETPPMAGTRPLFFGDDVTDEEGFAAAERLGGAGVLIGAPRETAARYRLAGVGALREWLERALEAAA